MIKSVEIYRSKNGERPSDTVVRAVADARNTRPTEMDICLYDFVDLEALDALVGSGTDSREQSDVRVSISVHDHLVVVDGTGRVVVTGTGDRSPALSQSGPDVSVP